MSLYLATERRQNFNIPHISDKISKTRKTLRPRPRLESGCRNNRGAGKEKEALNQTDSTESDEPGECLHYILFDCENYIWFKIENSTNSVKISPPAPGPQSS